MQIDELMTRRPRTITADTTISEAWEVLRTLNVRHLPVTNDEGGLVGLVSDRHFAAPSTSPLTSELLGNRSASLTAPVSTIMIGARFAIEADEDVEEAVDFMIENKMGALPIIDPEGGVVGIVSYLDIVSRCSADPPTRLPQIQD